MTAGVRGRDRGADFAEGHQLDAEMAARRQAKSMGWMLTIAEAEKLLASIETKRKRRR